MVDSNANRIAIITGSSTGIGFQTPLILARNGFYTYATIRNLKSTSIKKIASKEASPLKVIKLDIDDSSVKNAIQEIISEKQTLYSYKCTVA
jgi:NAD(P)-dependent dehydrogenase (short-subunit alcohol dehydrogenase family)